MSRRSGKGGFEPGLREEVADPFIQRCGIGFKLGRHSRKPFQRARRCSADYSITVCGYKSRDRIAGIGEPMFNSRIKNLKAGGVPSVLKKYRSRALNVRPVSVWLLHAYWKFNSA